MSELIITLLFSLLTIVLCLVAYYFKVRKDIETKAVEYINGAEDLDADGKEKFAFVVTELQKLVPAVFKPFVNKHMIETIVQMMFDKIEDYAKKQVK